MKKMRVTGAVLGAVVAALALASTSALAQTQWEKDHPRRDQVNDRLENQNRRIHHEVKEGDLTRKQAAKLHRQDRRIRKEERDMARNQGGHITKAQQAKLNRQENRVSSEIGK